MPYQKQHADFIIKYDPSIDNTQTITEKIITAVTLRRQKGNMPVVSFISGRSGRGKSWTALRIYEVHMKALGLDTIQYLDACNVYKPSEFAKKWDAMLHSKELRRVNILIVHEAGDLIPSKQWFDFLSQAIRTVVATSRAIKRIHLIIVSQSFGDITKDMRKQVDYYLKCERMPGRPSSVEWKVIYQDDHDLEKISLKYRGLKGFLIHPSGAYQSIYPTHFVITKPNPVLAEAFAKADYAAKNIIITNKLQKMMKEIEDNLGVGDDKLKTIVEYYKKYPDMLSIVAKRYKKGYRVLPEIKSVHDLTDIEAQQLATEFDKAFGQLPEEDMPTEQPIEQEVKPIG